MKKSDIFAEEGSEFFEQLDEVITEMRENGINMTDEIRNILAKIDSLHHNIMNSDMEESEEENG